MHSQSFVARAALAATFAGAVSAKTCMDMTVPVTVTARNAVFGNLPTPQTNVDVTSFALLVSRNGVNATEAAFTGFKTIQGTYNISARYCMPAMKTAKPKLQIMTPGLGEDKHYWDLAYNNYNFSYIDTALARGYHTLTYDRVGTGLSSHGDPRDEIQINLEVASLAEMTNMLRSGKFPGITDTSFSKIIHVGHSFGSAQTYLLTATYPDISDGIILTGYGRKSTFFPYYITGNDFVQARYNQPLRLGSKHTQMQAAMLSETYGLTDLLAPVDLTSLPKPLDYPLGYITNSDASATVYALLYPGSFSPGIEYFVEAGKQGVAIGEVLTQGSVPHTNPFKGPVLVITGSADVPFCGGDCANTGNPKIPSIPSLLKDAFPNTKLETFIVPKTGHGINLHYTAKMAYNYIQNFLAKNGL